MVTSTQDLPPPAAKKLQWADLDEEEDDGKDLSFLLPPTEVIGPDKNGIKKVIEYKFRDEGRMVKMTTTSRVRKIVNCAKKKVLERKAWPKFGDAVNEAAGAMLTVVSTEKIFLERPKAQVANRKRKKGNRNRRRLRGQLGNKGAILMVCRICGIKGDHWTAKCPYKDLTVGAKDLNFNDAANPDPSSGIDKSSRYIPPSQRVGAEKSSNTGSSDERYRNSENTVKVSNLSEDALEQDLRELFGAFGRLTRVYVATKRGFGFVSFVHREDAERAITRLNGYGYDNLILQVDWAPTRPK